MTRVDGYAAIEDYAVIGDGRTAALVARDGGIDWLCLPDFDSSAVFARLLDAERGGAFELAPTARFDATREYVAGTNVLATTFTTADGVARVTDALVLGDGSWLSPLRELVRKVEVLSGRVELAWCLRPRFEYGAKPPKVERRLNRLVAVHGRIALGMEVWGGREPRVEGAAIAGDLALGAGESAMLAVDVADRDPLVFDSRRYAEGRLEKTVEFWRSWSSRAAYDGPWRDLVVRSALVLKLLVHAPSGAIVAAPTTSLPEWIGGRRNWDYRYTWVRDAAFTLVELMRLGYRDEATSFFWWLEHATALTQPQVHVLYQLDGGLEAPERELDLAGYRGSSPVRVGNRASSQLQLDVYGTMLDALWLYACESGSLSAHEGRAVAKIADWVAANWRREDSGIWEVRSEPTHFTQSKVMCWVALDRAVKLAERGLVPDRRECWRREADAIRAFVDEQLWDDERETYVRASKLRDVDASLLLLSMFEFGDPAGRRVRGTVDAVQRDLRDGVTVRRYLSEDGVGGEEGGFLACSFWLVAALAKARRVDEAVELMDGLAARANDVGLFAEQLAPDGSFLGNFPQALSHLALIAAARAIAEAP